MYREMKVEEALEEYLKGRNVVLMDIIQMPDEAVQYQCTNLKDVFRGAALLVDLPDEPDEEPKQVLVKSSPPSTGKKKWFLNAADKELVREKYLAGMEMGDISKKLNLSLTSISRYVDEEGLGKERYKGQPMPSKGSAPVPSVAVLGANSR